MCCGFGAEEVRIRGFDRPDSQPGMTSVDQTLRSPGKVLVLVSGSVLWSDGNLEGVLHGWDPVVQVQQLLHVHRLMIGILVQRVKNE